jgi:rhodanese-related sulfurtransferase
LDRLEAPEAFEAQRHGAWLIDTRSRDQIVAAGAIPGAIRVPLSVLEWRLDPASEWRLHPAPDLDDHVVLVCREGYSSSLAARRLQQLGFERATDLIGGFAAWDKAGLPVE